VTDAVEKVGGMPPARNNRIMGADFANRTCAFGARLESMLLRDPLKILFQQHRPQAVMRWSSRPTCCGRIRGARIAASCTARTTKYLVRRFVSRKLSRQSDQAVVRDKWGLIRLDIGLLNNRGKRFAFLAREVCKGFAGEAGELDPEGIEALA
jgi:hypothetical protein